MINEIRLEMVLPAVFVGSEGEPPVSESHVWLREGVSFRRAVSYIIEAESGTGKSSLCAYLYGSRADYAGRILFDGTDVRSYGMDRWCELRREALAYLPQEMRLFPELSVRENILIKNRLTDYRTEAEIMAMLEELELGHKADEPAGRLSIGQQQRVAIVRALCQPFDFLLADEPVSHLDARNNAAVAAMIGREAAARGASVIATSVGNKLALSEYELMRL